MAKDLRARAALKIISEYWQGAPGVSHADAERAREEISAYIHERAKQTAAVKIKRRKARRPSATRDLSAFTRDLFNNQPYFDSLVDRARRSDKRALNLLLPYARDQRATSGRAFARKVLAAAGVSWKRDEQ